MSAKKPLPFVFLWRCHLAMSDASAGAKHVGDKLSLYMSPDGKDAYPAVSKLMKLTGMPERSVRRGLSELRGDPEHKDGQPRDQWLRTTRRGKGGRKMSTSYDAVLPPHIVDDGSNPVHDEALWTAFYDRIPARVAGIRDGSGTDRVPDDARNPATADRKPCHSRPKTLPGWQIEGALEGALKEPFKSYGDRQADAPYDDRDFPLSREEWGLLRDQISAEVRGEVDRGDLTGDEKGQLNSATNGVARLGVSPEQVHAFAASWMNMGDDPYLTPSMFASLMDGSELELEVWKDESDAWLNVFDESNGSRLLTVNHGEVPRSAATATRQTA